MVNIAYILLKVATFEFKGWFNLLFKTTTCYLGPFPDLAKLSRSLEQFIQTVKGQNNFLVTECFFDLFLEVSHI